MYIITLILAPVLIAIAIIITFPKIYAYRKQRELNKYYESLNIGDNFIDPFYSNDPFSSSYRMLNILNKQDNYILYAVKWYDAKTHRLVDDNNITKHSTTVEKFKYLTEGYRKVTVYE